MSEYAAFMRAIIAQPDDDMPRLIAADWFDAKGNSERAEFVRVQCEAEQLDRIVQSAILTPGPPSNTPDTSKEFSRLCDLRQRERELLLGRGWAWCGKTIRDAYSLGMDFQSVLTFRRGFVERIRMTWEVFRKKSNRLRASAPLKRIQLATAPGMYQTHGPQATLLWLSETYRGLEFELPPNRDGSGWATAPIVWAINDGVYSLETEITNWVRQNADQFGLPIGGLWRQITINEMSRFRDMGRDRIQHVCECQYRTARLADINNDQPRTLKITDLRLHRLNYQDMNVWYFYAGICPACQTMLYAGPLEDRGVWPQGIWPVIGPRWINPRQSQSSARSSPASGGTGP